MLQMVLRILIILVTALVVVLTGPMVASNVLDALPIGNNASPIDRVLNGMVYCTLIGFGLGVWLASRVGARTLDGATRWRRTAGAAVITVLTCGLVLFLPAISWTISGMF